MAWTFTDELGSYQAAVADLFDAEPERYNVIATILASLEQLGPDVYGSDPPVLGWWSDAGAVRAACLRTPPWALLITALPAASVGPLARALADRYAGLTAPGAGLTGINGAESDAVPLADAWSVLTGAKFRVHERHRLHRLGKLEPPHPMPTGAARVAADREPADRDVVRSFFAAFADEVHQDRMPDRMVDFRMRAGRLVLWDVAGEAVSMAGVSDPIHGVARVGPVYTPPHLRGRGYGAAVTAAVTRLAHERGATSVILYTDLANPTSNALYERLGYQPVEDRVVLRRAES
jgi:RimJ/RimL family protein N-acetyltransferase